VAKDRSKFRSQPAGQDPPKTAPPPAAARAGFPSGRVKFDERGNAVWEWAGGTVNLDPATVAQRLKRLENSSLEIADEPPPATERVKINPVGMVKGYNPYDSGKLEGKQERPRKRDLKRLSEWIALRKQAERNKHEK